MRLRLPAVLGTASLLALALSAPQAGAAPNEREAARLLDAVTVEGIRAHQRAFQNIANRNDGTRAATTPGYFASARYVRNQLRKAGYKVSTQRFEYLFFEELAEPELERISPRRETYATFDDFLSMDYSGSGEVQGQLVPTRDIQIPPSPQPGSTSGCEPGDFPPAPSATAIALIQRGSCDFALKATNARDAGYEAAIIFNEGQEGRTDVIFGTLGGAVGIPVIDASFAVGEELFKLARAQRTVVRLKVEALIEERESLNVLADSVSGDFRQVVVVGAHLDSVPEGPGINDNGSGTAVILETALQLAKLGIKPENRLRFAFWGAEEDGLVGSTIYVNSLSETNLRRIALNLNFDMLGSPNYARLVYDGDGSLTPDSPDDGGPAGSDVIEDVFLDYFRSKGLSTQPTEFDGRSDYGPFIEAGIPAGGLFSGAEEIKTRQQARLFGGKAGVALDPCYHQACDTIDNFSEDALNELGDGAAFAIYHFSETEEPFADTATTATLETASAKRSLVFRGDRRVR